MADTPGEHTSFTLLARIQSGEREAWRRLADLYRPLVGYWCKRAGVPDADLDDVVQDVWLAVGPTLKNFQPGPGRSFRGWLRGVARHKLQDWHRRHAHELADAAGGSVALQALEQIRAENDEAADPPDPGEASERLAVYRRAIELIRHEFEVGTWQAFLATAVDGKPAADAGAALGLSAAAVRMAKSRVLRRLREELGELFD